MFFDSLSVFWILLGHGPSSHCAWCLQGFVLFLVVLLSLLCFCFMAWRSIGLIAYFAFIVWYQWNRCVCIKRILSHNKMEQSHDRYPNLSDLEWIDDDNFKQPTIQQQLSTKKYNYRISIYLQTVTILLSRFLSRVCSRILCQFPNSQPERTSRQISPPALTLTPYEYKPAAQHILNKRTPTAMKIATLQFSPRLGDVQGNIQRADELLRAGTRGAVGASGAGVEGLKPDILVLSEMALTG